MNSNPVSAPVRKLSLGQKIGRHTVHVMVNAGTGERFVRADGTLNVPLQLLPLAAGRDAWLREVVVKCSECRTPTRAGDMEGGGTDLCCNACFEKFGEELAAQEAGN